MKKRSDRFVMQEGDIEVIKQGVPYVLKKDREKQDHNDNMDEDVICIDSNDDPERHSDGPDVKKKSKK